MRDFGPDGAGAVHAARLDVTDRAAFLDEPVDRGRYAAVEWLARNPVYADHVKGGSKGG